MLPDSSEAALTIYEDKGLAMVSATSTSSKLKSKVLFRTVAPTTEAALKYAQYIKNKLDADKLVIFYDPDSLYSKSLKEDFIEVFSNKLGGKVKTVSLREPTLNIELEIKTAIQDNFKWGFLIPSVTTDSRATAIARINAKQAPGKKLLMFEEKDLIEEKDLNDYSEGMILAGPCLDNKYMRDAKKRWQKKDITGTTATSYDATMALIEAINRSSNEPTREEILKNLKSVTLPVDKTSGFGLKWSTNPMDHFNTNRKYCIYGSPVSVVGGKR
jgi:ABC-type branched-subunit amino acid transport system substrate-binding protein